MSKKASGVVIASGEPESAIPKGTAWKNASGRCYVATSATRVGEDGEAQVSVECELDDPQAAEEAGTELTLVSKLKDVEAEAIVASGGIFVGGPAKSSKDKAAARDPAALAAAAAKAAAASEDAPRAFLRIVVNGLGHQRIHARYLGTEKGLHVVEAPIHGVPRRFAELPLWDPKQPDLLPALEFVEATPPTE